MLNSMNYRILYGLQVPGTKNALRKHVHVKARLIKNILNHSLYSIPLVKVSSFEKKIAIRII